MRLHQVVPRLCAMDVSRFHLRLSPVTFPKELNLLNLGAGMRGVTGMPREILHWGEAAHGCSHKPPAAG